MIERQIPSPMRIPSGLVVRDGPNTRNGLPRACFAPSYRLYCMDRRRPCTFPQSLRRHQYPGSARVPRFRGTSPPSPRRLRERILPVFGRILVRFSCHWRCARMCARLYPRRWLERRIRRRKAQPSIQMSKLSAPLNTSGGCDRLARILTVALRKSPSFSKKPAEA